MEIINKMRKLALSPNEKPEDLDQYAEFTCNLRFQLALSNIRTFFSEHQIETTKELNPKTHKILRIIKGCLIVIYSMLIFFEKPFHCYEYTTFYRVKNVPNDDCNPDLVMRHELHFNHITYRIIELLILCSFIIIQIFFHNERRILGTYTKNYHILQCCLYGFMIISAIDIVVGLIVGFYPFLNHFFRCIIIILLTQSLRLLWVNILYLLIDTLNILFFLLASLFWFGLIGFTLFHSSSDFTSPGASMYNLYILLATCNFPDIMINTFRTNNKASIFYFLSFIIVNYFIILSLLKALYYSSYFEVNKVRTELIIKELEKEEQNSIFQSEELKALLIKLKDAYSFTQEEFNNLNDLLGIEGLEYPIEEDYDNEMAQLNIKFITFLRDRRVEFVLTIVDFIFIDIFFIVSPYIHWSVTFLQSFWCGLFIAELTIYLLKIKLKKLFSNDLLRMIFLIVNLIDCLLFLVGAIIRVSGYTMDHDLGTFTGIFIRIQQSVMLLRNTRLISMLYSFDEFKTVFITLKNMKKIFSGLISTLFSLFMIFSSLSMILTGGKITNHAFDDNKDIPNDYTHINFNDYWSSFIACFCLMMINNMHIIASSLSYQCHKLFQGYYSFFYFLANLILLNIIQTLLLEMYLTIKANKVK